MYVFLTKAIIYHFLNYINFTPIQGVLEAQCHIKIPSISVVNIAQVNCILEDAIVLKTIEIGIRSPDSRHILQFL